MEQEGGCTARRDDDDVEEELLLQLREPKALNRQCLRCIEDHFDAIPDLRQLPGVVAQQVLEYMMKRRKGGSRTLNDSNVRKFLLHEGLQYINLNTFWLMPEPFRGLRCPHLVYLNLNGSLHVGDEGVTGIARASPMLQHLNVKGNRISDAALFELAEHCPRLEVLYVQCSAAKRAPGRKGRPAQSAEIGAEPLADQITNEGIRAIAVGCPQLRSLSVSRALHVTDDGVRILARHAAQLESLSFFGCSVTLQLFTILSSLPPTKPSVGPASSSPSLSSSSSIPSPLPSYPFPRSFVPSVCTKLRRLKLNFDGGPPTDRPRLASLSLSAPASPCVSPSARQACYLPALQVLKLTQNLGLKCLPFFHLPRQSDADDDNNTTNTINGDGDNDAEDGYFPSPSPPPPTTTRSSTSPSPPTTNLLNLPPLVAESPEAVSSSDSAEPALFNPLPSLVSLRLVSLPKLTDASILTALLPFVDQLEALELRQLTKVTGPTLERLLDARRRAERTQYSAAVWGQPQRDEAAIDTDADVSAGHRLRSLTIHHCQAAKSLNIELPTSLESLEISCTYWRGNAPWFADHLAAGCAYPRLRRIDCSMTYVNNAHLRAIARQCPHVTELVLADCHDVRDAGLANLFPFATTPSSATDSSSADMVSLYDYLSATHYSFPLRPALAAAPPSSLSSSSPERSTEVEALPAPQLRLLGLTLSKCSRITAPQICSPYLTRLDLNWSRVTSLANVRLPRLKTVDVTGCQQLDAESFFVFLAHSPRLRSLWAMAPSSLDHRPTLDRLTGAQSPSAINTPSSSPHRRGRDRAKSPTSPSSSPPSATSSSQRSPIASLRVLNVSGLAELGSPHVESVIANCRGLRTLHIGGCCRFTKALVDDLEQRHPHVLFKGWDRISAKEKDRDDQAAG